MKDALPELPQHTRPTGTHCIIRARDDLDPSSGDIAVQHSGRMVTAVPENVGLCEIVEVGPDVTNVRRGDVCFIDFFDVAQGYLLEGEELYLTQAMALRMTLELELDPKPSIHPFTQKPIHTVTKCAIHPLPGYVLTKHAPDRMTVAVTGCDRLILPRDKTTSGIVGGRNSDGDPCTFVVYEEVIEFTPGAVQQERYHEAWDGSIRDTYYEERRLKARIQKLERALIEACKLSGKGLAPADLEYLAQGKSVDWGVASGDLVVFCTDFCIQFRALGELYRCVPYKNLLAVVDDRAILAAYNETNPPKPLIQLIGGGAQRLYGT